MRWWISFLFSTMLFASVFDKEESKRLWDLCRSDKEACTKAMQYDYAMRLNAHKEESRASFERKHRGVRWIRWLDVALAESKDYEKATRHYYKSSIVYIDADAEGFSRHVALVKTLRRYHTNEIDSFSQLGSAIRANIETVKMWSAAVKRRFNIKSYRALRRIQR